MIACLISLAALAIRLEKPILAARLAGAVDSRLDTISVNLLHTYQVELGKMKQELLKYLEVDTFETAFSDGRQMDDEQTLEIVRSLSN